MSETFGFLPCELGVRPVLGCPPTASVRWWSRDTKLTLILQSLLPTPRRVALSRINQIGSEDTPHSTSMSTYGTVLPVKSYNNRDKSVSSWLLMLKFVREALSIQYETGIFANNCCLSLLQSSRVQLHAPALPSSSDSASNEPRACSAWF